MPHKDPEIRKEYFKNYYKKHKEELSEYRLKYRKDNKEKEQLWQSKYRDSSKEKRRDYTIKKRYDLSSEDFLKMLENQESKCLCCGKTFTKTPHIDHCHATGKVRGLLCSNCNTGLGFYEKYKEMYERYLNEV